MTAEELQNDIHYIRRMIESNHRSLIDDGVWFLSAGIDVLLGAVLTLVWLGTGLITFILPTWVIIVYA